VAFYSDKHTVFRVNKPDASGGSGMTQFGRALAELNIEILCANSSQAKGRVERANRTLQDRLVKDLRLAGICDMADGNLFLPSFLEHFNERFAVPARKPENLHRSLHVKASQLTDILCHREQRHVSKQLTLSYDRKQIILERSELSEKLAGQYVELYDFLDRPLEVRWKGQLLPYRVFSKDQRVSHTAVVENKRLGHALATVKAQQDIKHMPKVMTNSAKGGWIQEASPSALRARLQSRNRHAPSGGNDGLMESMEDRTMKLSGLPPFPQSLEITKCGDFAHSHRTTTTTHYDDNSALHS
jgi:hypothetical protein